MTATHSEFNVHFIAEMDFPLCKSGSVELGGFSTNSTECYLLRKTPLEGT